MRACLPKVAPVGDAENGDRRNVHAFTGAASAAACRSSLPEERSDKEERLPGAPETHPDKFGKEHTETQVELRCRGRLSSHGVADLLRSGMRECSENSTSESPQQWNNAGARFRYRLADFKRGAGPPGSSDREIPPRGTVTLPGAFAGAPLESVLRLPLLP